MDFLLSITSPEEMGTFLAEVTPAFRSKDLFQASTVSKSLVSLAFFHGFLTYKLDEKQRSVLTSPNLVMQSVYARALFAGLPMQQREKLEDMLHSVKPDLNEFKRVVRLGYDEAAKEGGKFIGVAAMKALVDGLL